MGGAQVLVTVSGMEEKAAAPFWAVDHPPRGGEEGRRGHGKIHCGQGGMTEGVDGGGGAEVRRGVGMAQLRRLDRHRWWDRYAPLS